MASYFLVILHPAAHGKCFAVQAFLQDASKHATVGTVCQNDASQRRLCTAILNKAASG